MTIICANCGVAFEPHHHNQRKYCSYQCMERARLNMVNARRREARAAAKAVREADVVSKP
jgi:hypothetical protein